MWQILAIFSLYMAVVVAIVLAIVNTRQVISAVKYAYWFVWGMYQQARYGGLPKQHYRWHQGQWQITYNKRIVKN